MSVLVHSANHPVTAAPSLDVRIRSANRTLSMREIRRIIPGDVLARMLTQAAITGVMPTLDPKTGQETSVALPISQQQQIELAKYLLNKHLPDAKPNQTDEAQTVDVESLPTDPEDIKRLPMSELGKAIEAKFTATISASGNPSHASE